MAIGKKTGGRKKGTPNKRTQSIQDKLDKHGCDPIEGMAQIAKQAMDEGDMSLALSAFKEIAQYVVPKRKAIELSNEEGKEPLRIEWKS